MLAKSLTLIIVLMKLNTESLGRYPRWFTPPIDQNRPRCLNTPWTPISPVNGHVAFGEPWSRSHRAA